MIRSASGADIQRLGAPPRWPPSYIINSDTLMRRRTPQDKKQLSLEKDRRNVYGESPHGARKSIPLRKKLRNRANRHQQESQLPASPAQLEESEGDRIESSMRLKAPKTWHKASDASLGTVITRKHKRRIRDQARKIRSKVQRAFCDGHFFGECPKCQSSVYILVGRHGGEKYGAFCAVGRGVPNATFSKALIHPCLSTNLPEPANHLFSLCLGCRDSVFGDWLCRLFGACTCPQCRQPFSVAEVVGAELRLKLVLSKNRTLTGIAPSTWRPQLSQWLYFQP